MEREHADPRTTTTTQHRRRRTGRPDAVVRTLTTLTDPRASGVLLVGECGSGKTHVLREVCAQHRHHDPRTSIVRTRLGDDDQFRDALQHAETPAPDRRSAPPGARRPTGIVAVDDLAGLSRTCLARLEDALDRGVVQVVGTTRTDDAPHVLDLLRPTRPLTVVELGPWRRADLAAHCAPRLTGGHLHEPTARRLLQFSEGNALVLTELVDQALETGTLRRDRSAWVWDGDLRTPPVARARLTGELDRLPEPVRDVLAAAALVTRVDVDDLTAAFGEDPVDDAEASGLLRITPTSHGLRAHVRPAYADVIRDRLTAVRRRRLARALAAAGAHSLSARTTDPLRTVTLAHLTGAPVDTATLVRAARAALRSHDPALAAHLLADRPDPDAVRTRATALAVLGRCTDAATLLGAPPHQQPLTTLLTSDPLGPTLALVGTQALEGRLDAACGALVDATDATHRRDAPVGHLAAQVLLAWCRAVRGETGAARALAVELREHGLRAPWPAAHRLGALLQGRCALDRGDVAGALAHLGEATVTLPGTDPLLHRYGLAQLALALAAAGRHADSGAVLRDAARPGQDVAPPAVDDLVRLTHGECLLVRGMHRAAGDVAADVARTAEARGHHLVHLLAAHLGARVRPSAENAEQVAAAASRTDFALAQVHVRHARAAADADARSLAAVAAEYDERGLHWLAAETAAACLRAPGSHRTATGTCRRILDDLASGPRVVLPPWWQEQAPAAARLTAREREVAGLVATGATSPQVARTLGVSVRTVDNHLQHCYRKLGVTGRDRLADVLAGPVSLTTRPAGPLGG